MPINNPVRSALAMALAVLVGGCSGTGLPAPPNGPSPQSFSTNNALVRVVNGAPLVGASVIVRLDGAVLTRVNPLTHVVGIPYPSIFPCAPSAAAGAQLCNYTSVPSGGLLVQVNVAKADGTDGPLVLVQALTVKFGGRYSIVLTAAPPPVAGATPGPFPINAQLFSDGHYLTSPGTASVDYHNASLNAGSVKLTYSCSACNGGVTVNPTKGASYGATLGPLQVPASAGYSFTATGTVTVSASAAQFSATNSSSSLPYAVISTFPNLSIYEVDGAGGAGAALLGSFDQNG